MNEEKKSWLQTLPFKEIFVGGLGALLPTAINIMAVDANTFQYPGHMASCIYIVKILILFSFGCAIVFFLPR